MTPTLRVSGLIESLPDATVSVASGLIFSCIFLALRHIIFSDLIRVPPEIYGQVVDFAGVVSVVMAFSYIVTAYSTILQALGDTKSPAIINAFYLVANIAMDPLFIFGIGPFPEMGAVGAAVTDLIGNVFSVATLALLVKRKLPDLHIRLTSNVNLDWVTLNLKIGLPVLVLIFSNSVAKMFQLRLINVFGVVAATAYSFSFIAIDLSEAILRGVARGTAIMVGQNLGAGLSERARESAIKTSLLLFAVTLVGAFLVYAYMDAFIGAFIQDPAIYAEAKRLLEILIWSLPFFGVLLVVLFVGRGSGHTLPPTLMGIARLWGFHVGLGYLLAFYLGYGSIGIWTAMAVGNLVTGLAALAWMKYGDWARPIIRMRKRGMRMPPSPD